MCMRKRRCEALDEEEYKEEIKRRWEEENMDENVLKERCRTNKGGIQSK